MGMPIMWQGAPWACPSCGKGGHGHAHHVAKGAMGMPIMWQRGPWACPSCGKGGHGHAHYAGNNSVLSYPAHLYQHIVSPQQRSLTITNWHLEKHNCFHA